MHHPAQCCEPDWATRFDMDPAKARPARRRFLAELAELADRDIGTHFPALSGG
jgi:hypothetical protein